MLTKTRGVTISDALASYCIIRGRVQKAPIGGGNSHCGGDLVAFLSRKSLTLPSLFVRAVRPGEPRRRGDRVTDRAFISRDRRTLHVLHCTEVSQPTAAPGQSLRIYSASGPTIVRCCSNRRQNGAARRMTRSATFGLSPSIC